jgi:hypothetical protein
MTARQGSGRRPGRAAAKAATLPLAACVLAGAAVALVAQGAGAARSAGSGQITITLLASSTNQTAFQVLIPN